jgi:hypothetical protein
MPTVLVLGIAKLRQQTYLVAYESQRLAQCLHTIGEGSARIETDLV